MTLRISHRDIVRWVQAGDPRVQIQLRGSTLHYRQCSHPECHTFFWATHSGGSKKLATRPRYCSDACFEDNRRHLNAARQRRYQQKKRARRKKAT